MFYCVPPFTIVFIHWKRGNMSFFNFFPFLLSSALFYSLFWSFLLEKEMIFSFVPILDLIKEVERSNKGKRIHYDSTLTYFFQLLPFLLFFLKNLVILIYVSFATILVVSVTVSQQTTCMSLHVPSIHPQFGLNYKIYSTQIAVTTFTLFWVCTLLLHLAPNVFYL